jgi:hypothetical protein
MSPENLPKHEFNGTSTLSCIDGIVVYIVAKLARIQRRRFVSGRLPCYSVHVAHFQLAWCTARYLLPLVCHSCAIPVTPSAAWALRGHRLARRARGPQQIIAKVRGMLVHKGCARHSVQTKRYMVQSTCAWDVDDRGETRPPPATKPLHPTNRQ